jgi:flagellar biosynthesis/type III secretory pathway chaperone
MNADAVRSAMRVIVGLLDRQAEVCRRLLALMQEERRAILSSRPSGLREFSLDKEALLGRARELEDRRLAMVCGLAGSLPLPAGPVTLSALAAFCDEDLAAELGRCRSELRQLTRRLQIENRRSEALCRQGLEVLRGAFELLKGMASGEAVYRRTGRMEDARMSGRLMCGRF